MRKLVSFTIVASVFFIQAAHAHNGKQVVVRQIISATRTASGQPIKLPKLKARVSVSEYIVPQGATLPVHKHPFPRFAFVLEGTISVTDEDTGQTFVYKQGEMIIEVVNQWHFGKNVGPSPVRLLVIDEVEGNRSNTILR